MTRRPLNAKEKRLKGLLLSGRSISSAGKELGIKNQTAYNMVDRLLAWGEIKEQFYIKNGVIHPYNPRIFEDPNMKTIDETMGEDLGNNALPSILTDLVDGVSCEKRCPEGYVEGHINGLIQMTVEKRGDYGVISDARGITYGEWEKDDKRSGKGSIQRKGLVCIDNQQVTIVYRWHPRKDGDEFHLYPRR